MTYPLTPGWSQAIANCVLIAVLVLASALALDSASTARAEADERVASEPGPSVPPLTAGSLEASELADDLIGAIARPELAPRVLEATYEGVPEQAEVFTSQLQEFPRTGNQYVVLSTGPAASTPGAAPTFLSVDMGGVHIPGGSPDGFDAYDVATLTVRLDLADLPTDPEPRLVFRYKFCSEEPPTFWGSGFQDYFTAMVRDADGQTLENIAVLPDGQPFTIDNARPFMNQVTGSSTSPQPPFPSPNDVVFNACTGIHTTDFDLTAFVDEEIELELQIGDVGDSFYDSAVFVDGLEVHAGPLPDFWVERVEFNQASQSFGPGQVVAADQLVSGKTTGVRVHVVGDDNEDDPQQVSAELHVLRNGNPVAGSPFTPMPRRITPVAEPSRTAMDANERATDSFEFRIPRASILAAGDYQFFVMVDPHHEVDEADKTNNRFPAEGLETVTLDDIGQLGVLRVNVTTVDGDGNEVDTFDGEDWAKLASQRAYTQSILPQHVLWPASHSLEWNLDGPTGWWLWSEPGGDLSTGEGRSALFAEILDILADTGEDTVMALVPRDTDLGANGWGYVGRAGGIVRTRANSTLVHEIAHNMLPAGTFDPPDDNHDPTNSGEDGYRPATRQLQVNKANILNVGSDDPWVSPTSYTALVENNELVDAQAGGASAVHGSTVAGQGIEALRMIGWVDEQGELRLRPIHTVEADNFTADDPAGDYLVELRDGAGETLASLRFSPPQQTTHDEPEIPGSFSLVVPRPEGLASIMFQADPSDPQVLGTVPVSANPPAVTVLSPSGGEQVSGTFTVEWEGSDPDGDSLAYTVLYTPDGGEQWHVLATNLTGTSLEWDTSQVPGGAGAAIKVRATDGVNSAVGQSGTFTVATKSPEAFVVSPESGAAVALGGVADFFGIAEDPEDGELSGDALEWSSDIDGVFATGEAAATTELSEGTHTITLTATDSDGNTATDSINFTVVDTTPPPPSDLVAVPGDGEVSLEWTASTSEFVDGYRVYWGTASGVYGADVAVGETTSHTVANLANGTPYYFAVTAVDAVGNESDSSNEVQATPAAEPPTATGPQIDGGAYHSLAIASDGGVWAWGLGTAGQLGNGSTQSSATPVATGLDHAVTVAAGGYHSLGVAPDGTVRAWGAGGFGQLGDGETANSATPVTVAALADAVGLAGGNYHSLAVTGSGAVWAWGYNGTGQLGDGTTTTRSTPVEVSGLDGVVAVAAGGLPGWSGHSLALRADGTVWAWGYNKQGQIGDGTRNHRLTPVPVIGIDDAVAIAAGGDSSYALRADGSVWAWGDNSFDQLGPGAGKRSTIPVPTAMEDAASVAAGGTHALAVDAGGGVWAWGNNNTGQLGHDQCGPGTPKTVATPVQVETLADGVAVAGGLVHSLSSTGDGGAWGWGRNAEGQVGDGTTTPRCAPVPVTGLP